MSVATTIADFCAAHPTADSFVLYEMSDELVHDISELVVDDWGGDAARGLVEIASKALSAELSVVVEARRWNGEYCGGDECSELLGALHDLVSEEGG